MCLLLVLCGVSGPIFAATPIMIEKNLFSEDRKPPSPQSDSASSEPAGQGMAIGNIQLDGVVFRNNSRLALLRLKNVPIGTGALGNPSSPFVSVHVGEMVNDYRVAKIDVQSVTLEKSGQTYMIGLFSANKAPALASAPPSGSSLSTPRGPAGKQSEIRRDPVFRNGFNPKPLRQALHGHKSAPHNPAPGQ